MHTSLLASFAIRALLACGVLLGGCSGLLRVYGGATVNPREIPGHAQASALMEFLVLQLKSIPAEQQRDFIEQIEQQWQDLRDNWESYRHKGNFPEPLKSVLAAPATLAFAQRPRELFSVRVGENLRLELPLLRGTKNLVLIAFGAQRGTHSVRLIAAGLLQTNIGLCFDQFDIYPSLPGQPWPCPTRDEE